MYALKYPHAGYIRAYQTECSCGCAEAVTVHSRSGRNLARHRPKKIFDRNYVSNCAARVSRYGRSRKLSVLALEWNGVADTTSLFQKYSLRKGRPATDYADVIGPRIERLMLFPKFELVEQPRSGFVSLPIFSGRDFALLRVADYAVHVNFTFGKHCGVYGGKLFGLFGPIDFVRLNRAILVLLGLAGSND